jgi:protoporphyrinogen oxidase
MQRIAILGAGITGLVIANRLAGSGRQVQVIDAYDRVGGNHKSMDIGPYTFDIGTFIFPSNSPFFDEFPGLWDRYHVIDYRPSRITPRGNIHAYPFDTRAYFQEQGSLGSALTIADIVVGKALHMDRKTVPSFAKYYLGRKMYEDSGLRNYIERLFGVPDREIDTIFASKRMYPMTNVASWRKLLKRAFVPRGSSSPFQWSIRPRGGFHVIYDDVRKRLEERGIQFILDTRLSKIERKGWVPEQISNGEATSGFGALSTSATASDSPFQLTGSGFEGKYDRVIATLPLPILSRLLGVPITDEFPALRLFSLFYSHSGDLGFASGVLYNFTPTGLWKRITVFSRYYGQVGDRDYFTVEVTLKDNSPLGLDEARGLRGSYSRLRADAGRSNVRRSRRDAQRLSGVPGRSA